MASKTLGLYSQASNTLATAFHNLQLTSGGGGGSQTLQQTLVNGNTTGGNDIIQSAGDALRSSTNADLRLELDGSGTVLIEQNTVGGSADPILTLQSSNNTSAGSTIEVYTNKTVPAVNDEIFLLNMYGNMSSLTKQIYSSIRTEIDDPTTATASAVMDFIIRQNGTAKLPLRLYGDSIEPEAILDDLASKGTVGQVLTSYTSGGKLRWATDISGSSGSSALINVVNTTSGAGTFYPTFTSGTSGNQTLRVDNIGVVFEVSGNRMGINTTTPQYNLDVSGAVRARTLIDNALSAGLSGQILSSTGSALSWISPFTGMTATGGNITTYYEGYTRYTAHTFLTTGSFTITSFGTNVVPEIDILIVGGGGGGGSTNGAGNFAGGGGAGCVIQLSGFPLNSTATLPDIITCSVGLGGAGGTAGNTGTAGQTTTFSIPANLMVNAVALGIDARGGGGGAGGVSAPLSGAASTYGWTTMSASTVTTVNPTAGGGGGAQGAGSNTTATTSVFNSVVGDLYSSESVRAGAYRGGTGTTTAGRAGCGGGGSSALGGVPTGTGQYVVGTGTGHITYWSGSKFMFGGGGLGATSATVVVNPTSALYGGGIGEAQASAFTATAGSANTGGGGGGSASLGISGASGGSGIIIVRYKS